MPEFKAWPKTPRLFRDMIVTEKIDGTNAAVIVEEGQRSDSQEGYCAGITDGFTFYKVAAQSRKRIITPETDNFGFAAWVRERAFTLVQALGVGTHYGEWWGHGIQRGYGQPKGRRHFSLFNVNRYAHLSVNSRNYEPIGILGLNTVPILYEGPFDTRMVGWVLDELARRGSTAAPGFMRPEGIIVYHQAANSVFKATIEDDEMPKGEM